MRGDLLRHALVAAVIAVAKSEDGDCMCFGAIPCCPSPMTCGHYCTKKLGRNCHFHATCCGELGQKPLTCDCGNCKHAEGNSTELSTATAGLAPSPLTKQLIYVATGNCDGEDKGCVPQPEQEKVIQPLIVDSIGSITHGEPSLAISTEGSPIWLTTVGNSLDDGCIVATIADKSEIFTHGRGRTHYTPSGGVNPVYASVTADGKYLLVANYHGPDDANTSTGASVASFSINRADCSLELRDVKNHSGHSVNPKRQGGAHPHSIVAGLGGTQWSTLAFACDLGMDQITIYNVSKDGYLDALHAVPTAPGLGPRHMVLHPHLPIWYVVDEMGESVLVFRSTKLVQTLDLRAPGLSCNQSKSAEIVITPSGGAVFATDRGCQNTVTSFVVQEDGRLEQKRRADAPRFPRGMYLTLGNVLLVAGQSHTEIWSYIVTEDAEIELASKFKGSSLPPHPATFTSFPATDFFVV